jgi:hypothetical protein
MKFQSIQANMVPILFISHSKILGCDRTTSTVTAATSLQLHWQATGAGLAMIPLNCFKSSAELLGSMF